MTSKQELLPILISIKTELASNTTETKNIVDRLDKLNGSVAKHEAQIALNSQAIALVTQTISNLQASTDTAKVKRAGWLDWLLKGGIALFLIIIYTILIKTHILLPLVTPGG